MCGRSCEPNCAPRIIVMDGQKRIVIYSKRAIAPGEELTYDYRCVLLYSPSVLRPCPVSPLGRMRLKSPPRRLRFNYEEAADKIPCHCGAPSCRGSLN